MNQEASPIDDLLREAVRLIDGGDLVAGAQVLTRVQKEHGLTGLEIWDRIQVHRTRKVLTTAESMQKSLSLLKTMAERRLRQARTGGRS